jgi:hypothetical protein
MCFIRIAASLPKSRPVTFPAPISRILFYIQAQFLEPRSIRKSQRRSHPRLVKAMGLRDDCDLHAMFWRYVSESYWNTQKYAPVTIQLEECGLVWHALTKSRKQWQCDRFGHPSDCVDQTLRRLHSFPNRTKNASACAVNSSIFGAYRRSLATNTKFCNCS